MCWKDERRSPWQSLVGPEIVSIDLRPRVIGGDVILVSTADWDNPHWTNKQHLAVRLGRRGMRVLYLESLGLRRVRPRGTDLRRIIRRFLAFLRGPRPVAQRVWVFSP